LGEMFRSGVQIMVDKYEFLTLVRGRGLLNAVMINDSPESSTAWDLCVALKEAGLLAKPTHGNIIRFAPPLVITEEQMQASLNIIEDCFETFASRN